MVKPTRVLALIPARGGSKSTPGKNIKALGGFPLIAYSIAAGLQARLVDEVIVSTDDEGIAEVARAHGATIPFLRPAEFAQDDTLDFPVFEHAVRWFAEQRGYVPEIVVQLRPTSPFRATAWVDEAIAILQRHPEATAVRAVIPSGQNPYKMWRLSDTGPMCGLLEHEFDEPYNMPRQKLPPTYWQTGQVDAMRSSTLLEGRSMTGSCIYPLLVEPRFAVDIDTPDDFRRAEELLPKLRAEIVIPAGDTHAARLEKIRLVIFDFDGVMTDNRVWVDQAGTESVSCNRSDGWGLARLVESGVKAVVISTEQNQVVSARCRKLKIDCVQGCDDKITQLRQLAAELQLTPEQIAYVGNDVNDLTCLQWVGYPVAVGDAWPEVKSVATHTTAAFGGAGAVREFCDLLLSHQPNHIHAS